MEAIAARWYHIGRQGEKPRVIVVHCTVSPEMGTGAEAVGRYFARGERRASTHRVADNNSTVICVADANTAFGAAGANRDGLHIELVGQPDQTAEQWADDYSTAELFQAGLSIREWSAEFDIPLRWLTVKQVADKRTRGLCTHADVSKAFPEVSTGHWDPGPHFPKDRALDIWTIQPEPEDPPPPAPPLLEDSMDVCYVADKQRYYITDGRDPVNLTKDEAEQLTSPIGGYRMHVFPTDALWRKTHRV